MVQDEGYAYYSGMKTVKTALIGLGYWGPNLLRNFIQQPCCELAVCCDMLEERRRKMQSLYPSPRYTGEAEEIFSDPTIDLVLIATPTSSHFPLAKRALESGKHVFIEKPMTATLEEADTLLKIASSKQRMIFVDHTFVFATAVRKLASFLDEGKLGDLLCFDSIRINLGLIQKDANVLQDLAVHDLSILGALNMLEGFTHVLAVGHKHFGAQIEEAHLHLWGKGKFRAHIHVSWLSPVKIRRTILTGTKAMATYDDVETSEKIRLYDRGIGHDDTKPDPFFPVYRSGDILIPALPNAETLSLEAKNVLESILKKEIPQSDGVQGRRILQILSAANESLMTSSPVAL